MRIIIIDNWAKANIWNKYFVKLHKKQEQFYFLPFLHFKVTFLHLCMFSFAPQTGQVRLMVAKTTKIQNHTTFILKRLHTSAT